jgi:hypothetical protein
MVRVMTRDVKDSFVDLLKTLYADDEGKFSEPYRISCAKWHWALSKYSPDPDDIDKWACFIELAYQKEIDLDKDPRWKHLMRRILPKDFMKKMSHFQQVPQIAVMDDTKMNTEEEEDWFE